MKWFLALVLVISLSPWVVILRVDHHLQQAAKTLCNSPAVTNCAIITFNGEPHTISFYTYRGKERKFYRFYEEK